MVFGILRGKNNPFFKTWYISRTLESFQAMSLRLLTF